MINSKKIFNIFMIVTVIFVLISCVYFYFFSSVHEDVVLEEERIEYGQVVTATFVTTSLNSYNGFETFKSLETISCTIKDGDDSCNIILPTYNVIGAYSLFWSIVKLPEKDLTNEEWNYKYFYGVGTIYELSQDTVFYPNTNCFHSDWGNENNNNYRTYFKYRNFNIIKSEKIGNTIFEFEKGIPISVINDYLMQVKQVYSDIPWLFVPTKVFVLTEETYEDYSLAYGLTQTNYYKDVENWNTSVSTIDLQYDTVGILREEIPKNSIAINATIHELAHAWDSYYRFNNRAKTESMLISETIEAKKLYEDVKESGTLYEYENGYISEIEFFAGMTTNYYWHVLQKGPNKPYYALKDGEVLSTNQKQELKAFIEKYAKK